MQADLIFTAQSATLRAWAARLQAGDLAGPSSLPGWTVADLLGHLVAVHDSVAGLRPAPDDAQALSIADYIGGYVGDSDRVADIARTVARDTAGDPLGAWDRAAAQAKQTLGALGAADRLVTTRRGPMLESSFLSTRIIELVVHAGDLGRSLPGLPPPPVLPTARQVVVTTLREVLTARAPDPDVLAAASTLSPEEFVDLATGRARPARDGSGHDSFGGGDGSGHEGSGGGDVPVVKQVSPALAAVLPLL